MCNRKMPAGKIEYGTWKNGASIYKDRKGYFIIDWNPKTDKDVKKYLPKWKPKSDDRVYFNEKTRKWQLTKPK